MQDAQLRRHSNLVQDPVDSVANPQIVFLRFNMNIGRTLENRFANDLVHEFHHGRLGILVIQLDGSLRVLQHLKGTIRLENFVECFCADTIESLHRAQNLRARHQDPFGWLFQKLRRELAADGIEKVVCRQHHRVFLHLDGQNVVLKNKAARQR